MKRLHGWLFSGIALVSLVIAIAAAILGAGYGPQIPDWSAPFNSLAPILNFNHWTVWYSHYFELRRDFFVFGVGGGAVGMATPSRVREIRFPGFDWYEQRQQNPLDARQWVLYERSLRVNIWLIILPLLIPPARWLQTRVRERRRKREGRCIHCGYDLRATLGRCPECGKMTGG